jgi:hypothetical protein
VTDDRQTYEVEAIHRGNVSADYDWNRDSAAVSPSTYGGDARVVNPADVHRRVRTGPMIRLPPRTLARLLVSEFNDVAVDLQTAEQGRRDY